MHGHEAEKEEGTYAKFQLETQAGRHRELTERIIWR